MTMNKLGTAIIVLLAVVIVGGGIAAWSRYSPDQPIEISLAEIPDEAVYAEIYIGGAVVSPGFYPLTSEDSVAALIDAAGGTADDLAELSLYVSSVGEEPGPQRIDINRAEAWLLEALPDIGETRAQAIVDHRRQNGPFKNINELMDVEGIGATTYGEIEHLIAVAD